MPAVGRPWPSDDDDVAELKQLMMKAVALMANDAITDDGKEVSNPQNVFSAI